MKENVELEQICDVEVKEVCFGSVFQQSLMLFKQHRMHLAEKQVRGV
jgi:hypothetical protein